MEAAVALKLMTTERKMFIWLGIVTVLLLIGGYFFATRQDQRLNNPLAGQEVSVTGRNHLPQGTPIQYNSNPPAAGPHYPDPQHAGTYTTPPPDGNLVHSLEHGAVILWYKADLSQDDVSKLKKIFDDMPGKTIMTPRKNLDVPVAVTSWGRILKLKTIDEKQIETFYEVNIDRGPEQAPI